MNSNSRQRSYFIQLNTKDCANPQTPQWHISDTSLTNIGEASISVNQIFIPNAVYPVNSTNNTVKFVEVATEISVVIPPGSYTGTAFATAIAVAMTAGTLNARTYTASYDMTSLYTLSVTGSGTFYFNTSTASRSMGFVTFPATLALTNTGTVPINCSGSSFVDVLCTLSLKTYSSTLNNTTIARIPLTENFGSYILWEPQFEVKHELLVNQLNSIGISLQDDRGAQWLLPQGFDVGITFKISYD